MLDTINDSAQTTIPYNIAVVIHSICGARISVPYLYEDDVFMNPVDCGCGVKFFPKSARFPVDSETDQL